MRKLLLTLALSAASLTHAQQQTLPLWPSGAPELYTAAPELYTAASEPYTGGPEADTSKPGVGLVAGRSVIRTGNVSIPTLAVYLPPAAKNTGAAVLVFPGGGYSILAYDLEGTEVCTWLNSIGVTCGLVKYRVPFKQHFPQNPADLEDAQQAMRLTRAHAAEWHLDPQRIGVLGFSAGGHLAAILSNHADYKPAAAIAGAADLTIDARGLQCDAKPNFTILIYPAYLTPEPALNTLAPGIDPTAATPPTFLLMAENDPVHVENVLVYGRALKDLKVPAEIHVFSQGGHGYGLRPTELPITHWPTLAETWLHTIHILDKP